MKEMMWVREREFNVAEAAVDNNVAAVHMNHGPKLWTTNQEKAKSAELLKSTTIKNGLPRSNLHIGGFPSGGNAALLSSDCLAKNKELNLVPEVVFAVDSAINSETLHESAQKNAACNF